MRPSLTSGQLDSLMEQNMGLVVLLVKSFKPSPHQLDEFMQLGRIGLWKAICKHDPKRSELSTCIWHYVKWEIQRHLYKEKHRKKHLSFSAYDYPALDLDKESFWELMPDSLSRKEKRVIQLKLEGHTFVDIGSKLGYSKGWANKTFRSAVKKINESNGTKKKNIDVQ